MTPETTQSLIEEVKRRAGELKAAREKATQGEWRSHVEFLGPCGYMLETWHAAGPFHPETPRDDEHRDRARTDAEFITHAANESIPLADLALRLARVVECLDGSLGNTLDCLEQNEDPDTVAIEIVQKAREQARKIACGEE